LHRPAKAPISVFKFVTLVIDETKVEPGFGVGRIDFHQRQKLAQRAGLISRFGAEVAERSARELVARVRAVLRRAAEAGERRAEGATEIGDVRIDPGRRSVSFRGDELELSRKEFDLLRLLIENAGSVVTRERLIDEVWDTNWFGSTKTLDVHVSGLRKRLDDDAGSPRYIHTVRGVGFRFSAAEEV